MSTCTKWVNEIVITCKNWTYEWDQKCTEWADEGSNRCSQWADEGHNECGKWEKDCHWYTFWNCVIEWLCDAWYWVAEWVCKAWYWVAKWVCKAIAWIVKAICVIFSWFLRLVCVAWDTIRCILLNAGRLVLSIFSKRKPQPKIKHVFVLMLENRSFDHMLGFSAINGIDINGNPTTINGANPAVNKNLNPVDNTEVPVSFPADFQLKDVDKDPGHEFENTLTQLGGKDAVYTPVPGGYPPINNSGFIEDYFHDESTTPERIMKCYSPEQLPIINALAKEFSVCDNWFSSLPGPTWPNRFFLLAGTSGGLDDSPSKLDIVSSTTVEGYRFENGNVFDLLDEYCVPWRIFEGDDFPVSFALNGMNLNALQGRFKDFDDFESQLNRNDFKERFVFIEPKYGAHKFDITGPGDFTCGNSMHPLDDVIRGEKLIKKVYETIRNSQYWESSLLLVTFDEHGGFYDHVNPPAAVAPGDLTTSGYRKEYPDGHPKAGQLINFQFDQLGVRVPALVISPFTTKNVIDHTTYDHTSMLSTVEKIFGMKNLTQRDKAANDFLHLVSLATARTDTPAFLPNAAINPNPIACEEDDESSDQLLLRRSELRIAKERGSFREKRTDEFKLTSSQIGFMQVALLKVLQTAVYPERDLWIQQYKEVTTGIDAALFMTEAKLKIRYSIDLKKFEAVRDMKNKTEQRGKR